MGLAGAEDRGCEIGRGAMICIQCSSIFLRPAEPAWTSEGILQWARRFQCGGCGAIYVVRMTKIGTGSTDREKHVAVHNPPPQAMVEDGNGGVVK